MVRNLIKRLLLILKPFVWSLAEMYDIKINKHCLPQGQNPLIIEDYEHSKNHNIPKSVYFNTRSGTIRIGKDTVFGEDVLLLTGKHSNIYEAQQNNVALHFVPENGRDIIVGKGCYIGSGAIIVGNVSIGDYAVIGAGSVVTKDVPTRTFVAGVPAKVLKVFSNS